MGASFSQFRNHMHGAHFLEYFYTSVYFKTSEKKTPTDPHKISSEIFSEISQINNITNQYQY
jgi:hypothetical protein